MAKPFNFDVPIATERSIESIADVVITNFATKDEAKKITQDIQAIQSQLQGVESTLTGLNSRIGKVV